MLKLKSKLFLAIFIFTFSSVKAEKFHIITNSKIPAFQNTALLINKQLKDDGKTSETYDLQETDETNVLQNLTEGYIFSIGKEGSMIAKKSGLTFFYSLVTRPQRWGFINTSGQSQGNYSGCSMSVSPEKYFSFLMKKAKIPLHPVLFYSKNESNHTASLYKKTAAKYGIELVLKEVTKSDQIMPFLHKLKNKINMVISIPDATAYSMSSIKMLLQFSLRNKIPFIGYTKYHSKAGTAISIYPAELAFAEESYNQFMDLLKKKNTLTGESVYYMKNIHYAVNKQTLKLFSHYFHNDLLESSDEKY